MPLTLLVTTIDSLSCYQVAVRMKALKWMLSFSSGPSPDILNQALVTIYSRKACNNREILNGAVTESMICAGKLSGGVDSCQVSLALLPLSLTHSHTDMSRHNSFTLQGDSGGPLVVKEADVWWLAGDTSWGIECALKNKPGVYGNVPYFLDWIYWRMQVQ